MTATPENSSKDTPVTENDLDVNSLNAIRSILMEEEAPAPRQNLERVHSAEAPAPESEPPLEVAAPRKKAEAFPPLDSAGASPVEDLRPAPAKRRFSLRRSPKPTPQPAAPKAASQAAATGAVGSVLARVKAYRPTPAHIALAAFVLLVLTRPWLVLGLTVLFLFIMVGVFLIAGYDGFWQGAIKLGRWYANRRPERAAILHARLDSFAVKWDAVLDRFPEGTVDGLYLPDFGEIATADDRHAQAMERRLSGLHGNGA